MNKLLTEKNIFFLLISVLGLIIFILSIYDILTKAEWWYFLLPGYIILFLIVFLSLFYYTKKRITSSLSIEEFEKKLKGGLFHFKCQICSGIFAIKKSRENNQKIVKMKCPDCGSIGKIPKNPISINENIPEKKSNKAVFRCKTCGEGITIWAEGSDLYNEPQVLNCPFCGVKKPLNRVI